MSKDIGKDQTITNLLEEWAKLHRQFRRYYQESMDLRSILCLYASTNHPKLREGIDEALRQEHPDLWEEVQAWRDTPDEVKT